MPKDDETGLQKHTMNLYPGDYEKLRSFYPDVGAAAIVRRMVRKWIEKIEANGGPAKDLEVEIKL